MLQTIDRYNLNIGQEERILRYQTARRLISNPLPDDLLSFKGFYHGRLDNFDDVSVCCEAHILLFHQHKSNQQQPQRKTDKKNTHCALTRSFPL